MRAFCFLIVTFLLFQMEMPCLAQQGIVKELASTSEASYLLANIHRMDYARQALYGRSFFVSVYTLHDPKATPAGFFEEHDGVLSSILIAVIPDGDYYTESKLFKIEGLENPRVRSLGETQYPEFVLSVQSGQAAKRKTTEYAFQAEIQNLQNK